MVVDLDEKYKFESVERLERLDERCKKRLLRIKLDNFFVFILFL
jgi:hypothetical protein